jgi:SAM-dependent methyltransferase
MQRVYRRLMRDWLPVARQGRGLKTDLFEEAITPYHLLADLGPVCVGIDCSLAVAQAARHRLASSGSVPLFVVGDLRQLPLKSEAVEYILSGSSLDHFPDKAEIAISLAEMARVLTPGGTLIVTFDNPHNPVVWLRNHLPFRWLNRLRLVPYYVGATYRRDEARQQIGAVGLTVTAVTAVAHVPRAPAVWMAVLVASAGWKPLEAFVTRLFDAFEVLERWPTRYRTGYYLAIRAAKITPSLAANAIPVDVG